MLQPAIVVYLAAVRVELAGARLAVALAEIQRLARAQCREVQAGEKRAQPLTPVAIDMCTVFKAAIRQVLPHALLVVDHFHVVQLANRAVTEVRRRVTLSQRGRRGRGSDPEWRIRNRLTRSAARMSGKHVDRLVDTLDALPAKIGPPILAAWNAKEDLHDLLATARTQPHRESVHRLLRRFYTRCAD